MLLLCVEWLGAQKMKESRRKASTGLWEELGPAPSPILGSCTFSLVTSAHVPVAWDSILALLCMHAQHVFVMAPTPQRMRGLAPKPQCTVLLPGSPHDSCIAPVSLSKHSLAQGCGRTCNTARAAQPQRTLSLCVGPRQGHAQHLPSAHTHKSRAWGADGGRT